MHLFLVFISSFWCTVAGFGAPGIIPPKSFIAERWYPTNLPTVMPPWKMPGIDISQFRTARPHQSPGSSPTTTTPTAPTNSLPMPPGTSTIASEMNGPHPPAPQQMEASGVPSSEEVAVEEENGQNTTTPSSTDELMTISVTATNLERSEPGVLKILSPLFEDITKIDNISDINSSEEVLRVTLASEKAIEGSGDSEPELMSTLETTIASSPKSLEETTTTPTTFITSTTIATDSSTTTVATIESSKPETEPITTTIPSTTTTPTISSSPSTIIDTRDEAVTVVGKPKTKSRPTKECKDILFLLDSSGNVLHQYEKQKKYIEEIVSKLEEKNPRRVSLITFAGRTRQKIVVPLPEEPNGNKFIEKLRRARFLRGVTAAGAAISVTTQYVLQKGKNVQVVVVTDGFSFDDVHHQSDALRTIIGKETYVTGRYFPVVKNVLLSIGGSNDHVFFDKNEPQLIDALQC